jgi:ankyrin repeat protein
VAKALLAARADVNAQMADGTTALFMASEKGLLELVRALLAGKADVNAARYNGCTALFMASGYGHLQVVQALLAAGADMNVKVGLGASGMVFVSQQGEPPRNIFDAKVEAAVFAPNGLTAISFASQQGHKQVVQALLAAGADPPPDA